MDIPIDAKVSCYDGDVGKSTYFIVDLVTERVTHFVLKTDQYNKQFVVPIEKIVDLIAGLTIMALLVPEGTAYAQWAGMPPQAAFYAAPIGLVPYAIFGTSRQLVVAVFSAVAVMSASILGTPKKLWPA